MEDLFPYFRSILEQDESPIVVCDLNNDIIYMNPAAIERYADDSGEKLIGRCLFDCHGHAAVEHIVKVVEWFQRSPENNMVHTMHSEKRDVYMVALRDEDGRLIGYYEKHESRVPDERPAYVMG